MNCAFFYRCFLMLVLLVLPFGCEGASDEMTAEEEAEMEEFDASDDYQSYNTPGEAPVGGHGGAGGHGGGSTPQ